MKKHRIVLTGGGTGGHVYPALAVYEKLVLEPTVEAILYIGACGHLEEKLCEERRISFRGLNVAGMPRKPGLRLLYWPVQTLNAIVEARHILGRFDPSVVLGTGGYASAAPLAAALHLGVPIAVHEPDAHPGLVNRLFSRSASLVSLGMEGALSRISSRHAKILVNGNPIRASFLSGLSRAAALLDLGLSPERKTITVTGGSQGAKAINDVFGAIALQLLDSNPDLQIIHQAGGLNLEEYRASLPESLRANERYLLRDYFSDMAKVYAASDLVVSRAGAMTLAELTASGLPSIFIPYPFAAQNHQMHNARALELMGGARVLPQDELSPEALRGILEELLGDDQKLEKMAEAMKSLGKPNASEDLSEEILRISDLYLKRVF